MPFCTSMAQRTASTTLRNSTRAPSPVRLTTRPWWTAMVGSIRSLRSARSRAKVRSSSAPASRLYPTTSAARIAAIFRVSLMASAIVDNTARRLEGPFFDFEQFWRSRSILLLPSAIQDRHTRAAPGFLALPRVANSNFCGNAAELVCPARVRRESLRPAFGAPLCRVRFGPYSDETADIPGCLKRAIRRHGLPIRSPRRQALRVWVESRYQ